MIKTTLMAASIAMISLTTAAANPYVVGSVSQSVRDVSISNLEVDAYTLGVGYNFTDKLSAQVNATSLNGDGNFLYATANYSPFKVFGTSPYLSVGAGLSDISSAKDTEGLVTILGAGVDIPVTDKFAIRTEVVNFNSGNQTIINKNLDATALSIGIKYQF